MRNKTVILVFALLFAGVMFIFGRLFFSGLDMPVYNDVSGFDPRGNSSNMCLPSQLTLYMRTPVTTLDPPYIFVFMDNQVAMTAFGQLVALDQYENIIPYLADKWEILDGGKKYIFHLDKKYKFSDGRPITADDVVFTFQRLFKLGPNVSNFLFGGAILGTDDFLKGKTKSIRGIKSVGDDKVEVVLTEPKSNFLLMLTNGNVSIIPSESEYQNFKATEIISSGAFTVEEFSNDKVVLKKNPYHPVQNNLVKIVYQHENKPLCALLESGTYDFVDMGPYDGELCSNSEYNLYSYPGANIWFIAFGKAISADVRKKIIQCADKQAYDKALKQTGSSAVMLNSIFPRENVETQNFDEQDFPGENREMTCDFSEPVELKLIVKDRYHYSNLLSLLFSPIKNLIVTIEAVDDIKHRELRGSGEYDMLLTDFVGSFSEPTFYTSLFLSRGSVVATGYQNSEFDRLANLLSSTVNVEEKRAYMSKIEKIISQDSPAIFLKQHYNNEYVKKAAKFKKEGWFNRYFFVINKEADFCK